MKKSLVRKLIAIGLVESEPMGNSYLWGNDWLGEYSSNQRSRVKFCNTAGTAGMIAFSTNWSYLFVLLFGLSTWITINGVFSQIPILMRELPEKYDIPTNIVLLVQLANSIPLVYSGIIALIPQRWKNVKKVDTFMIYIIMISGCTLSILFGIFWNTTIFVFGKDRSVVFFILVFFLGSLDCMTSVIYYPYISNYGVGYMSSLSIGSYSTGLLVGIIAFIQDPGSPTPRFTIFVFGLLLSLITLTSLLSFTLFHLSRHDKTNSNESVGIYEWKIMDTIRIMTSLASISFFENGVYLALVPYTFAKYIKGSQLSSWQINATLISKPFFTYLAYKIPYNPFGGSENPIFANLIWIASSILQIVISLCYPNPPLKTSLPFGGFLVVLMTIGCSMMAFCKTKEILIAQEKIDKMVPTTFFLGITPMRMAGFSMQFGSLIGSIIVSIFVYTYF
jgi:hypothetical protein